MQHQRVILTFQNFAWASPLMTSTDAPETAIIVYLEPHCIHTDQGRGVDCRLWRYSTYIYFFVT